VIFYLLILLKAEAVCPNVTCAQPCKSYEVRVFGTGGCATCQCADPYECSVSLTYLCAWLNKCSVSLTYLCTQTMNVVKATHAYATCLCADSCAKNDKYKM